MATLILRLTISQKLSTSIHFSINVHVSFVVIRTFRMLQKYDRAFGNFDKALKQDPLCKSTLQLRAHLYIRLGKLEEALPTLMQLSRLIIAMRKRCLEEALRGER